jgi:hypothetical protein
VPFSVAKCIADWRREIVEARIELADEHIARSRCHELWSIVDTREWLIKLAAASFEAELEQIDRELEAELHPSRATR